jgi:hypothetical protein
MLNLATDFTDCVANVAQHSVTDVAQHTVIHTVQFRVTCRSTRVTGATQHFVRDVVQFWGTDTDQHV